MSGRVGAFARAFWSVLACVAAFGIAGAAPLAVQGETREVHAGESSFEPPGALHTVAESASASEPALAIAVSIVPDGAALARGRPQFAAIRFCYAQGLCSAKISRF
jgi:hypothetical protein